MGSWSWAIWCWRNWWSQSWNYKGKITKVPCNCMRIKIFTHRLKCFISSGDNCQEFLLSTMILSCSALSDGIKRLRDSDFFHDPHFGDGDMHVEVARESNAFWLDIVHQRWASRRKHLVDALSLYVVCSVKHSQLSPQMPNENRNSSYGQWACLAVLWAME